MGQCNNMVSGILHLIINNANKKMHCPCHALWGEFYNWTFMQFTVSCTEAK